MKQNKLVIVVLVVIAVLFVLGLSSGGFRKKDKKDDDLSMSKAQELKKNSWIGNLDNLIAPFRSSLDFGRIKKHPECQVSDGIYKLTGKQDTCNIIIAAKDGADIEEAVLSVKEGNVNLMVPYPDDKSDPTVSRGPQILPGRLKHSKAITDIAGIRPGAGLPGVSQQPLQLSVVFMPAEGPANGDDQKIRWEVTKEVKLMVLEKGGTINLECKGCRDNQTVTVTLK
jgi:hypothetical protein